MAILLLVPSFCAGLLRTSILVLASTVWVTVIKCRRIKGNALMVMLSAVLEKLIPVSSLWVTIGPGPRKPWPDVATVHSMPRLVLRPGRMVRSRGMTFRWRLCSLMGLSLITPVSPPTIALDVGAAKLSTMFTSV